MKRFVLSAGFALTVVAAATFAPIPAAAQPDGEGARALQAAIDILGGVPRAQCGPPAAAGTPCVAPYEGLNLAQSTARGIAAFSVTFVNEPGSYVAFFGRTPSGSWQYWYGAQDPQSPLITLPGALLACTNPSGGAAQLFIPARGGSETLAPLTRLTAEEFVLTRPAVPGPLGTPTESGLGWYRISAPAAGWVPETEVTDAMFGDCDVHDIQYRQQSAGASSAAPTGGGTSLTGVVWTWQRSVLGDGSLSYPQDSSLYTLEFLPEGRIAARADCNRAMGPYMADGSRLEIGPLAVTRALCPPGSLSDEFVRQLGAAALFSFRGGQLYIELADGGTMRFAEPAAAQDTASGVVTYRERIALPPDARLQVQLADTSRADAPAIIIGRQIVEVLTNGNPSHDLEIVVGRVSG